MRRILKSLNSRQRFSILFLLVLFYPIANPCDLIGALLGGDNNNATCAPFVITAVTGLPFGPAKVSWVPIAGATSYNIVISTDYETPIGNATAAGSATSASNITLDQAGVAKALNGDGLFVVFGTAITGQSDPPFCEAGKSTTFTISQKNKKPLPSKSPDPTAVVSVKPVSLPPTPIPSPVPTFTPVPKKQVTLSPHLIVVPPLVATCPPGHYLPPACPEIPR